MLVLIDADPIVYRSGFAAETSTYEVIAEGPAGELEHQWFAPGEDKGAGDQMKAWLKAHEEYEVLLKEKHVSPEPKEHALHLVNQQILSIVSAVSAEYKVPKTDLELHIYLSGPDNFRDKVATIKKYKGNRDALHKPHWYQAIRDHLTQAWDGKVVHGIEADDKISILSRGTWPGGCVIATIDKDLDQCPGNHYDYLKKVFYCIKSEDADFWFWCQVLSGDPTDNIGGAYKVGPKGAVAILNEADHFGATYWEAVVDTYQDTIDRCGERTGYAHMGAQAAALENARLVYMLRFEQEPLWTPTSKI